MEEKKVAIITGGSRGIGKEIAKKFAKENYNLVINYVSEKTNTEELKKEFEALGAEVLFIKTNVTSYEECEKMAKDAINKFGKIDVLVNNAGVTKDSLLLRMKEEDFDTVINVNLKGTFNVTKACIPYMMKKKSGKIVNISSVVGISGNSGQANYAASKAGIIGFTKSVAKELASRNILANCVAPGYIATDMTNGLSDAVKESINNQIPLKRVPLRCRRPLFRCHAGRRRRHRRRLGLRSGHPSRHRRRTLFPVPPGHSGGNRRPAPPVCGPSGPGHLSSRRCGRLQRL